MFGTSFSSIIVNETWFWCGYHPTKRAGIDILISAAAVGWPQREVLMHIIDTLWPHGSPCILYSVLSSGQNSSRYSGHMGAIPRLFYLRRKLHQILLLYSDSVFITLTLSPCPINDSVFRDHHYLHTFSKEAPKKVQKFSHQSLVDTSANSINGTKVGFCSAPAFNLSSTGVI